MVPLKIAAIKERNNIHDSCAYNCSKLLIFLINFRFLKVSKLIVWTLMNNILSEIKNILSEIKNTL